MTQTKNMIWTKNYKNKTIKNWQKPTSREKTMNIVFMGTPEIAKQALFELLRNSEHIVGVFTREDKPVGRKQVITCPPVKKLALENDIPVVQPKTLKDPQIIEIVKSMNPDLIVVVAYGRILPPEILRLPKYGCINLHVSLLPQYRGAAPIQWAVINGEKETGVTIMQIDEGLDTGAILAQQKIEIGPDTTSGELFEEVGTIGAELLAQTVQNIKKGEVVPVPQQGEPTFAPPLKKEMAEINFLHSAKQIHNLVRGANPWPTAWFMHEGKRIKVINTKVQDQSGEPGEILQTNPLVIACGENSLRIEHVLPEGSKPMTGKEWASGKRFTAGMKLQ